MRRFVILACLVTAAVCAWCHPLAAQTYKALTVAAMQAECARVSTWDTTVVTRVVKPVPYPTAIGAVAQFRAIRCTQGGVVLPRDVTRSSYTRWRSSHPWFVSVGSTTGLVTLLRYTSDALLPGGSVRIQACHPVTSLADAAVKCPPVRRSVVEDLTTGAP